ncbi:GM22179 [Drosophila sechellia]|uniref:GM22179 n=1 Tax=Drosophila sechellia TaxID=7238 RepID=B4IAH2_DROSE|nr:GM22179 [Drosophila sechellia]
MGLWRDLELKNPADSRCLSLHSLLHSASAECDESDDSTESRPPMPLMMEQRMTMWQWSTGGGGKLYKKNQPDRTTISYSCHMNDQYGTSTGLVRDQYGTSTGSVWDQYGTSTGLVRDQYGTSTGLERYRAPPYLLSTARNTLAWNPGEDAECWGKNTDIGFDIHIAIKWQPEEGKEQQKHSVFNEPFAALALNLLIELEPLASSFSGSFFHGSQADYADEDEDEDEDEDVHVNVDGNGMMEMEMRMRRRQDVSSSNNKDLDKSEGQGENREQSVFGC